MSDRITAEGGYWFVNTPYIHAQADHQEELEAEAMAYSDTREGEPVAHLFFKIEGADATVETSVDLSPEEALELAQDIEEAAKKIQGRA